MKLTIDDREPKELIDYLKKKYKSKHEVEVAHLPEGDYVSDHVICERKSIGDLNASLADGRYIAQLNRISTYGDCAHLLMVTGNVGDYVKKMRYIRNKRGQHIHCSEDALMGAIAMAAYRYNFDVIIAEDDERGLQEVVAYMAAVEGGKYQMPEGAKPMVLLSRLFGIPLSSAKALFDRFGSIKNVMDATKADLMSIPGIGPAKAKKIKTILMENIND